MSKSSVEIRADIRYLLSIPEPEFKRLLEDYESEFPGEIAVVRAKLATALAAAVLVDENALTLEELNLAEHILHLAFLAEPDISPTRRKTLTVRGKILRQRAEILKAAKGESG